MKKDSKHIDELYREELGSYIEQPPAAAWDALEKRLAGAPPAPAARRSPRLLFLLGLAGMLAISLSVGKLWSLAGSNGETAPTSESRLGNTGSGQQLATNTAQQGGSATGMPSATPPAGESISDRPTAQAENATGGTNTSRENELSGSKKTSKAKARLNRQEKNHQKHMARNSKRHSAPVNRFTTTENADDIAFKGPSGNEQPLQTEVPSANPDSNISQPNTNPEKKPVATAPKKAAAPEQKPKDLKRNFPRFEAGIKTGFERGFDNEAAQKWVVSPYLQYNLSARFSLMLQPAYKSASLAPLNVGKPSSYYRQHNDSTIRQVTDSVPVIIFDGNNDKVWVWHDVYSQSHDSIVKSHNIGGHYSELELPILLKYKLARWFSVYGGLNLVYNKSVSVNELTYSKNNIVRTDSTFIQFGPVGGAAPTPEFPTSTIITYNGNDIASYHNPYVIQTATALRVGYMLGFTFSVHDHWLFDGLVQQTPTATNMQGGYNINNTLSALYFRLSVGYKLTR